MYEEVKMEKLTINLPPIEIGRIDILVEAGYYPSRTEFIRAAIRKTLDSHHEFIDSQIKQYKEIFDDTELAEDKKYSKFFSMGVIGLSKNYFEKVLAQDKKIKLQVVGLLNIDKKVTADLILKTVEFIRVFGVLKASPAVKSALNRIKEENKNK
jgi:Arc/MetJ-type ribon-helix-helix transcriptional regulator